MTFYDNYLTFLINVYIKTELKFVDYISLKAAIRDLRDPLSLQNVKTVLDNLQQINKILDCIAKKDLPEEEQIINNLIDELKIISGNEEITEADMRAWLKINYNVARLLIQAVNGENWLEHELDVHRESYEINRDQLNSNINRFQFASRNTDRSLGQQDDEANESLNQSPNMYF
ncbi:MAG TPA: hypothetical protein PK657_03885 [Legionella sp.]|nr:hypothetical protein [Legionella sp.]